MGKARFPDEPRMVVDVELRAGETPAVVLRGDVDFRRAPRITEAVARLLEQGHKRIDIQLANVEFMDSSGISALLDSVRLARERDARLVLVSPTRQLLRLLEESGFKPLFDFGQLPTPPAPSLPKSVSAPVYWQMSEFSVPCDLEFVADIRNRVAQVADSMPFTAEDVADIKLAVGEAASNAFRYGCPGGRADSIGIRCIGDSSGLTVEVTDSGPGFDPSLVPEPGVGCLDLGGRGIFFMKLAMDKVEFVRLDQGMLVRLVKFVKVPPSGESQD